MTSIQLFRNSVGTLILRLTIAIVIVGMKLAHLVVGHEVSGNSGKFDKQDERPYGAVKVASFLRAREGRSS